MTHDGTILEIERTWTGLAPEDDDDDLNSLPIPDAGVLKARNERHMREASHRFLLMLAAIQNLRFDGRNEREVVAVVVSEFCFTGECSVVEPLSRLYFPSTAMRERARAMLTVCVDYAELWGDFSRNTDAEDQARADANGSGNMSDGQKPWVYAMVICGLLTALRSCGPDLLDGFMEQPTPSLIWIWLGLIIGAGFFILGLGHIFWSWRSPQGRTVSSLFVVLLVLGVAALLGLAICCAD